MLEGDVEVLICEIAGECYGLLTSQVREVLRAVSVERLPKAPPILEGVVNVRGVIVPVLDIRKRFGYPRKRIELTDHFVLAEIVGRTVAIRVDRAIALAHYDHQNFVNITDVSEASQYVAGIVKLPDGLLLIHDLDAFLSQAEAADIDDALIEIGT